MRRGNQGWSTAGRAGRPRLANQADSRTRPQHAIRAYDDEWEVIKAFAHIVKHDPDRAARIMKAGE